MHALLDSEGESPKKKSTSTPYQMIHFGHRIPIGGKLGDVCVLMIVSALDQVLPDPTHRLLIPASRWMYKCVRAQVLACPLPQELTVF